MIKKINMCLDGNLLLLPINNNFVSETVGYVDGQVCKRIECEILKGKI